MQYGFERRTRTARRALWSRLLDGSGPPGSSRFRSDFELGCLYAVPRPLHGWTARWSPGADGFEPGDTSDWSATVD